MNNTNYITDRLPVSDLRRMVTPRQLHLCNRPTAKGTRLGTCGFLQRGRSHEPGGDFPLSLVFGELTAMKYMLLIYTDENSYSDGERQECYVESTELLHDLNARGQ